ncbi:MAG: hypothetical protein WBE42_26690 [Pseudolabrys sp.]
MQRTTPVLSEAEAKAYSAPFPDARYKAGVRRFLELVMVSPEMEGIDISRRAIQWKLLKQIAPPVTRVAVLRDSANSSRLQCNAADRKNKVHLAGNQIGSHRGKQRRIAICNLRN